MTTGVKGQIKRYAEHVDAMVPTWTVDQIVSGTVPAAATTRPSRRWRPVWVMAAAFVAVLLAVGMVALLPRADQREVADEPAPQPSTVVTTPATGGEPEDVDEPATPTTATVVTPPGYTWTELTLPPGQFPARTEVWGVAHTGSRFVAVGRDGADCAQVWVSPDGAEWEGVTAAGGGGSMPCPAVLHDVASTGPVTVAVGQKGDVPAIWVSGDGYDWAEVGSPDSPLVAGDEIRSVAGSSAGFVAAGSSLWFSPDGQTWVEATAPPIEWVAGVTGGPNGFLAVGSLPTPVSVAGRQWASSNAVLHSADGRTWTVDAELEGTFRADTECWVGANAVAHGASGYVIAGDCTSVSASEPSEEATRVYSSMWTSDDGLTWAQVPHDEESFGEPAYIAAITADDSGYVAAGWSLGTAADGTTVSEATVWFSADGESWTRIAISGDGAHLVYGVAIHEGTAVVVGQRQSDPAIWLGTRP